MCNCFAFLLGLKDPQLMGFFQWKRSSVNLVGAASAACGKNVTSKDGAWEISGLILFHFCLSMGKGNG